VEILLAALALVWTRWTGGRSVLVDLEGHGRDDLADGLDLSRSVGWFTSQYPLHVELARVVSPLEVLEEVRRRYRETSPRGSVYGVLRYLHDGGRKALAGAPEAEVSFNYLGRLDEIVGHSELFEVVSGFRGPERSPRTPRSHPLEVNAAVTGGRLQVVWNYSETRHRPETIEHLADGFLAAIEDLVARLREDHDRFRGPEALLDVELSDHELGRIFEQLGGEDG
jgi:non-ribosomal peptide synthase protein (TIGR01720 family)